MLEAHFVEANYSTVVDTIELAHDEKTIHMDRRNTDVTLSKYDLYHR